MCAHVSASVVRAATLVALLLVFGSTLQDLAARQGAASTQPLTLLSKEGRRALPVTSVGDQEFVALDDLAAAFQLTVREESGAVTVSYKGKTVVLTPDQALASVSGRLVSLPAAPVRTGRRLLVPVEFISRALTPIHDARLELRKSAHLVIVGDVRVPFVRVRYEAAGATARLTIDATPRTDIIISHENERLSIKFEADALDVVLPHVPPQEGGSIVENLRLTDAVSLVVELGPRFGAFRSSTQPIDNSSHLVIDMMSPQEQPAAAAAPPPPPPALGTVGQETLSIRTITIDPGHGGNDGGAAGARGAKEKDLTLAVARRLKTSIEGRLGLRVLLTRDDDRDVPLDDRAALANNNKADVFISLHAGASRRPATSGASIFYAALDEAADAARESFGAERVPVFSGGSRNIELVMWDLAQIRHIGRSAEFASVLAQQLRDRVPLGKHPIERAPLRVLESANMPAVIVEMGYLSNADQERQLTSGDFQTIFAHAIGDALVKFRDHRQGDHRPSGAPTPPAAASVAAEVQP